MDPSAGLAQVEVRRVLVYSLNCRPVLLTNVNHYSRATANRPLRNSTKSTHTVAKGRSKKGVGTARNTRVGWAHKTRVVQHWRG